jgi:hypothetical protein
VVVDPAPRGATCQIWRSLFVVTPVRRPILLCKRPKTVATEATGRPAESPGGSEQFVNAPSFFEIIIIRFFFSSSFFGRFLFFSLILVRTCWEPSGNLMKTYYKQQKPNWGWGRGAIFFPFFPGSQGVPFKFSMGSQCVPRQVLHSTSLSSYMLWQMLSSLGGPKGRNSILQNRTLYFG